MKALIELALTCTVIAFFALGIRPLERGVSIAVSLSIAALVRLYLRDRRR